MTFGVIGYGSFGKLMSHVLSGYGEVIVHSPSGKKDEAANISFTSLEEAAKAEMVILAVNLDVLDQTSKKLAGLVNKNTIIVDVCSVKSKPIKILQKNFGENAKILATHPLFGPQTVKDGSVSGKNIVVCPPDFEGKNRIIDFLKDRLKLNVIEMSAEEHDHEMAWVHALTFFVGRGLMKLDPPKSKLSTGYYQKLLDLVELESTHSIELFNTVQRGNPFAADIRREFMNKLEKIDSEVGKD